MRFKTSELDGPALNWAVDEARGQGSTFLKFWNDHVDKRFVHCQVMRNYCGDAGCGAQIIFDERITLRVSTMPGTAWAAFYDEPGHYHARFRQTAMEPLVAAMRVFVNKHLGDEVEVPDELL